MVEISKKAVVGVYVDTMPSSSCESAWGGGYHEDLNLPGICWNVEQGLGL